MSRSQRTINSFAVSSSSSLLELPISGGMVAWLAALIAARWLMPTEGTGEGLTLWLTQLVLFTAMARTAWLWRFGERRIRLDAMDAAIALLIVAQVISALSVVFGVGNARAAINLAWEWIGSGVLIWMLRQELTSARIIGELSWGLSLTAGVLAGYGAWQHYVGYDQMSREYERLTSEHDRLAQRLGKDGSASALSASDARKLQSLRAEMTRQQIPVEADARRSLEQRVKESREPLGLFALANTFAGLLIVMLLVTLGLQRIGLLERFAGLSIAAIIAFCLLLTKSRTAWVGLVGGLGWWALRASLGSRGTSNKANFSDHAPGELPAGRVARRSPFRIWGIVVGIVIVVGIGAAFGGSLDKAVLSEAPKSLRYRLEYWQATWATIREHVFLGTGPGNFRDYYLAYKLPESSEEIADPHNFVLDVWANAGILGLAGIIACITVMAESSLRDIPTSTQLADDEVSWTSPCTWGSGLAFPVSAIGMDLLGLGTDERIWWLCSIWWGIWLILVIWSRLRRSSSHQSSSSRSHFGVAIEAAAVALLVHLLGAGGIAMPAITQLLWLVWAMRRALTGFAQDPIIGSDKARISERFEKSPSGPTKTSVVVDRVPTGVCAFAATGFCLVCLWTAVLPELIGRTALRLGDAEWEHHRIDAAQAQYLEASQADRWAIEPLERLAELAYQRWQQSKRGDDFDDAMRWLENIRDRLPFASRSYRRIGEAWLARFEQSHSSDHSLISARSFAAAVERYPHHALLLSEWATACEAANLEESAREAARQALQQDEINRRAGHADKYLAAEIRERMNRLAGDL